MAFVATRLESLTITFRPVSLVSLLLLASLATITTTGCQPRQKRNDWRNPATPHATCTTDTDCPGGTCAIELGATQGTCSGTALPPLPPADAGARPGSHPLPNIQPSPSDIKL